MMNFPSDKDANPNRSIAHQGVLYIFVGVTSALVEVVLFQVLYQFGILSIELSNVVALMVSTSYNFLLNGRVTFQAQGNKAKCLVKYLILFAFNVAFTTMAIAWLVSMGWDSLIAKLATMCCVVLWNFVLYRKVVFV